MRHISQTEQINLIQIIREHCGDSLHQQAFMDCCFELFEDISGMETIPLEHAIDIANELWRKYRGQTARSDQ